MLLILIVLVALGETRKTRFIQQIKNTMDAKDMSPIDVIDPKYERSLANKLLNAEDIPRFNANFIGWMIYTWGIDITTGIYDPVSTGYFFSNGFALPVTIINPQQKVFIDTVHPQRGHEDWFTSISGWYVGFYTAFTVTRGTNAGATIDSDSSLIYSMTFFVKAGEDWSNLSYKEAMLCQTDVTTKVYPNMYVAEGNLNAVVRYKCFDLCTTPNIVCDGIEIGLHDRYPNGTMGETIQVTYMCA